jgi:cholesterol transport system auxiliary component
MKTEMTYMYTMIAVAFMLSGCGGSAINKNQYVLDVTTTQTARPAQPSAAILEVRSFTIDSEFSGRQIVYRTGEFKYAPDYYNEFLISPATMITEVTRNWLASTGLFARVLEPGSAAAPTCVLDGSIAACYADIRDKAAPAAVLKMRLFYSRHANEINTLVWSRAYEMREPMKNTHAESFLAASSSGLQTILEKLQTDLSEQAR